MRKIILLIGFLSVFLIIVRPYQAAAESHKIKLHMRSQILIRDELERNTWQVVNFEKTIPASQIAVIICDMWAEHWSCGAIMRIEEMAPRVNEAVKAARAKGVQIIHAPSGCMMFYEGAPARQRIARYEANIKRGFLEKKHERQAMKKPDFVKKWGAKDILGGINENPYNWQPLACRSGGSDTNRGYESKREIENNRQHAAIEIDQEKDVISDNGREIFAFLHKKGIKYVVLMGVHTNMCILDSWFGIKAMVKNKINAVLARDLTDVLYNPAEPPYINHDEGTQMAIAYIEKFWCPTISSSDLIAD